MVLHEVDTFVHNKLFEFLIRSLFHVFSKNMVCFPDLWSTHS